VEYEISIPLYLTYNRYLSGYINIKETGPVKTIRNKIEENKLTYVAQNVKPYKIEPYVNDMKNYISALQMELASADYSKGEFVKEFANSWQAVAKRIYDDEDFGKQLEFKSYFKRELNEILKPDMSRRQKIDAVFKYVQARMNWNMYYGYSCYNGVKEAFNLKTGNIADINLILTAMLREAGVDANPVLVSTRSNGVALYPTLNAYNYVIAAVEIDGKTILLDATNKNTVPDIIPLHAINWVGRIIKSNGIAKETSLMANVISQEMVNVTASINPEGTITGRARNQYHDYNAMLFRDKITGQSNENCLQMIQKQYTGTMVNDYKILNKDDLSKPVAQEYSFTHNNLSNVINDKLYFSPFLFFAESVNPFIEETRQYPVDFVVPVRTRYNIIVTIPEGYNPELLPEALSLSLPNNMGSFSYSITAHGNTLQLTAVHEIKQAIISQEHYAALKSFYQKIIEKQNEKIVLKKS